MAIKLSNGTELNPLNQRDARGNAIYADTTGNLYTQQGGNWVLSRSANPVDQNMFKALNDAGQSDFSSIIGATRDRLGEAFGNSQAFEFPSLGQFRSQSESDINQFFDKELELLDKTITQAKSKETEKRDILNRRLGEDQQFFFKTEDKDFARALEAAQGGFAGKNTFTSGFRNKAIGQDITDRELGLEKAKTGFGREQETIDTDFKNFMNDLALKEEEQRLGISREKESSTLARQQLLQEQEKNRLVAQQQSAKDFIREKLGA